MVFICENNQYSMGTPLYRTLAVEDVTERAAGFAIERDRFNGDDVLEVQRRIGAAVERAPRIVPTLIEVETYRSLRHSISGPGNYRSKDEIEQWKKRDAVIIARDPAVSVRRRGRDRLTLEAHIKAVVQGAVRFAEQSPPANPADIWTSVYAQPGTDPRRCSAASRGLPPE